MSDPIEVVPYDPRWPEQFARIAARVQGAVPAGLIVAIEHVGSTSVPGLAAKPILDIDVVIATAAELPAAIMSLTQLGYKHEGDRGIPGRAAFTWPPGESRHHLYVCDAESDELRRHLVFRDYLRAHAREADQYAALKLALVARFRDDRTGYSEAKAHYIQAILAKVATKTE